jgi:hypothetical protein
MRKSDKIIFITAISLAIAASVFGVYLLEFAARDWINPTHTLFGFFVYNSLFLVITTGVITVLAIRVKNGGAKSCYIWMLLTIITLFAVSNRFANGENFNSMFLNYFTKRINNDVGVKSLNDFFYETQNAVNVGLQNGSPVDRSKVPASIQNLFRSSVASTEIVAYGKDAFGMRISWGGPLFNWGIEMYQNIPEDFVKTKKAATYNLSTNTFAFIGK